MAHTENNIEALLTACVGEGLQGSSHWGARRLARSLLDHRCYDGSARRLARSLLDHRSGDGGARHLSRGLLNKRVALDLARNLLTDVISTSSSSSRTDNPR